MRYKDYYQVVKTLKSKCKSKYPILIRRVKMFDYGTCYFNEETKKFIININKNMSQYGAIDTVIHEMSHILAWREKEDHGKKWGIAYSKLYSIYEKIFLSH